MIISASRRTDIPTFYSDWFFQRIKEEYVLVRNPMNIHQISKINLSPDVVDGVVFWTKNPIPMMNRLNELKQYSFYFQFTLNAYGTDVEPNVPSKNDIIIPAFKELSEKIGKDKVVWRYDPIFINEKYTLDYHYKYFELLVNSLHKHTEKCTISFIDFYKNAEKNMKQLDVIKMSLNEKMELVMKFAIIAAKYGIQIDTCAESVDFGKFGITHAHCIDKERFERISGYKLDLEKDKTQRLECGCVSSIDIGMYNTCKNGCNYCYANYSNKIVDVNYGSHNKNSPLLCGEVGEDDIITERKVKSCRNCQISLY